jgi:hypothetical protein
MPNQYTYIDNGTWEAYGSASEIYSRAPQSPQQVSTIAKSSDASHAGTFSGKGEFLAFPSGQPYNAPNFRFHLTDYFPGSSMIRPSTFVALQNSGLMNPKKYKFTAWVMTPSTNPIGTDDVPIAIAPFITKYALPNSAPTGQRRAAVGSNSQPVNPVYVQTTVGACKDVWVQISYEFTTSFFVTSQSIQPHNQVCVFCADSAMIGEVLMQVVHDAIVEAGTMNVGGILYIDDIQFDEVLACNLALGSPSYTKTDETAVAANDGTITVHATSQFTLQYSLDNVVFQNGNVFSGKAPGVYNVYVKDLGGCVAPVISNIVILEFTLVPPPPPPPPAPAGTLDINKEPVNKYNFISWFQSSGKINFATTTCSNVHWDLAKFYRLNKIHRIPHMPAFVNDEQFSFYINFTDNYNYGNFSSLRLDLVNNYGVVQQGVGVLQRVFQADGLNYYIYANVILSGVAIGMGYRLAITDTSTAAPHDVLFVTQEFECMLAADAPALTIRFRFACSVDIYKYLYTSIPDFLQQIRLRVSVLEEDIDGTIDQYRSVSSGKLRNVAFDLDLFVNIETYWFDDLAHRAMFVFQVHDIIFLNDQAYLVKQLYKVQWDQKRKVNKGTIELFQQEFSTLNRYGDPNGLVVTDPVLGSDNGNVIGT